MNGLMGREIEAMSANLYFLLMPIVVIDREVNLIFF